MEVLTTPRLELVPATATQTTESLHHDVISGVVSMELLSKQEMIELAAEYPDMFNSSAQGETDAS